MPIGDRMAERGARFFRAMAVILLAALLSIPCVATSTEGASYRFDPIIVEGDGGFAAAGFSGSGTIDHPYVLSDVNLDATGEPHGIRISNTTAHFRIGSCTVHDAVSADRDPLDLSASGSGVLLINVTNAVIEDYMGEFNIRGITVVSSSDVLINGSRFHNNHEAGVHLVNCLDGSVTVANSTFTVGTGDDGLLLEGCQGVRVEGNSVSAGVNGVAVRATGIGQGGNVIIGNALLHQSGCGVLLGGSSPTEGDRVLNNTVSGAGGAGVRISFGTSEISGNTISGCLVQGIVLEWTGSDVNCNTLANNTVGIFAGEGADGNVIRKNLVQDGTVGVLIGPSQGNRVLNNTILRMDENSGAGIQIGMGEVGGVRIEGNNVSYCNEGLRAAPYPDEVIGMEVVNNTFLGSLRNGTFLLSTVDSLLIGNRFLQSGGNGIYVGPGCRGLILEGNEASHNALAGLYVRDSDDNEVMGNVFLSNVLKGVHIERGTGNDVRGNAFLFNNDSGRRYSPLRPQAFCGEAGNSWSQGTGNLWADWLSPDDDQDGIVDLPYDISGGYQDLRPLSRIDGLEVPADIIAPTVTDWAPQGRDAEHGAAISVTFSEDMNASTVTMLINNVTTNGIWNDRTFTSGLALEFETDYQVLVHGEDLSGNQMAQFAWAFRTEDIEAEVVGRVVDDEGGPISGVLVIAGEQNALTNVDGRFSLLLSPGDHILNISKGGYLDRMVMVHVEPGGDMSLEDIPLESAPGDDGTMNNLVFYVGLAVIGALLAAAAFLIWRNRK